MTDAGGKPVTPRVAIEPLGPGYLTAIRAGLEWMGGAQRIAPGTRVFIKPNLTFPTYRAGVMTSPDCVEQLIVALKDYTGRITVGEADSGGYNRFSMTEVFERTGLKQMSARYGFRLLNLSFVPSRPLEVPQAGRRVVVSLPAPVLEETDLFISMPVPKVHANTGVSLSLKNLWGLIQEPSQRLRLHCRFAAVVHAIARALPPSLSVVDGRFGLTRNGPMRGDVVQLGWLLASDSLYAADRVVCQLIGVDHRRIPHLRRILEQEGLAGDEPVSLNREPTPFVTQAPFFLKREWTDYPGVMTFNSRFLAYLGYESVLARPLHWALYRFREPFY